MNNNRLWNSLPKVGGYVDRAQDRQTSGFVTGDYDGSKKQVAALLRGFGYAVIDLGNLRDGERIQQAGGPLAGREVFERG